MCLFVSLPVQVLLTFCLFCVVCVVLLVQGVTRIGNDLCFVLFVVGNLGWDMVEWLERCASIPMIMSSNPSGGSEFTFRSDLLLTARGGSM
jgi:hypothetical protein